jgi:glycosyltransferase involved in cell wall biosynthesis
VGPNVSVCIPAYRSEAFIHDTLRSVLAQTYSDFVVEIAVEPPAEETLSACAPFLRDDRVRLIVNPQVLGWAENMKRLLRRVATPYFFILPHDDILQPDYIATLLAELISRPHASIAYSDIVCFGHESFRLRFSVTEDPIFDRFMSFFLGGMDAPALRGMTRSSVLDHGDFPTDRYEGFAVECEWMLYLLITGAAVHVPRSLYLKRTFGPDYVSASRKRLLGRSREYLFEALEDHRARVLALIRRADLPKTMKHTVELAAEAAILRRHMTFNMGAFLPVQLTRSEQIMTTARALPGRYGQGILAMSLLAMSQHALIEGDAKAALDLAIAAVDADPSRWEGLAHLAGLQLDANRSIEAHGTALRAWAVEPHAQGLRELMADCESNIERAFLLDRMQSGRPEMLAKRFDAAGYLIDHPDIAAGGLDPWRHYHEHGWREGRKFRLLSIKRDPLIGSPARDGIHRDPIDL